MYRIIKETAQYGRRGFSYPDTSQQRKVALKIGMKIKPLVEQDIFNPVTGTRNRHPCTNVVSLRIDVKAKERRFKHHSEFLFW